LFDILERGEYRLNLTLGATLPTGKISKRGTTATLTQGGVLPFTMQGGSCSLDILAGGTFQVQNDIASIGAQINSVIRFKNNNKRYHLGDQFSFSVWGAYNLSDWVSVSLRGLFGNQSDVAGSDPRTDGAVLLGGCCPTTAQLHDTHHVIGLLALPKNQELPLDRICELDRRLDALDSDVVDGKTPALDGTPGLSS